MSSNAIGTVKTALVEIEGMEYNTSTTTIGHYVAECPDLPEVAACEAATPEAARAALVLAITAHLAT